MQKELIFNVFLILGVLIIIPASVSGAEKSTPIQVLAKSPAALFKWGLYHLEEYLISNPKNRFSVFLGKNREQNRIKVMFLDASLDSFRKKEEAQEMCSDAIDQIKGRFGVNLYKEAKNLILRSFSRHQDFEATKLSHQIDNVTLIGGQIAYNKGSIKCKASLLSKNIVFSEI
ncbi:hypothetical protein WDW89_17080 [Deltaproteobacteria bacterium TL4]